MRQLSVEKTFRDSVDVFFYAASDALFRAGINKGSKEKSACIEAVINSFLGIEALLNRIFYHAYDKNTTSSIEKFLKKRWKRGTPIVEKLKLISEIYAGASLPESNRVLQLFHELVDFRNAIVHNKPEEWENLVEYTGKTRIVHIDAPSGSSKLKYPQTRFSGQISQISITDAEKAYEVALLVAELLDSKFNMGPNLIIEEKVETRVQNVERADTKKYKDVKKIPVTVTYQIKKKQRLASPTQVINKLRKRYFVVGEIL